MAGKDETITQLMEELAAARRRVADLEGALRVQSLAEESIGKSEERFRRLAENAQDMLYRMSLPEGRYEYVSPASTRLTGYTPRDLYQNPLLIARILDPAFADYFKAEWEKLAQGQMEPSYEYKIIHRSGEERWLYQTNTLVRDESGRPVALEGVVTDVTVRKKAEETLRESEQRFRSLLEATSDWVWQIDKDNVYTYVSPKVSEVLGYEPEEMGGKTPFDFMPPHEAQRASLLFLSFARARRAFSGLENLNVHKDGRLIVFETSGTPLFDGLGNYAGYMGFDRDVTARRHAEETLRHMEEKYHAIFDNAIMGIFQTTPDGRLLSANPALARKFGFASPEEMMRLTADIGEQHYVIREDRGRFLRLCEEQGYVEGFETQFCRADGSIFWVSMNVREIRDGSGKVLHYEGTMEDITERKRVEEALRNSEERIRTLLESMSDGVYILDREGCFTFVNDAIVHRSGHPREWYIGRHYLEVIDSEHKELTRKNFETHIKGELLPPYEIELSYPVSSSGRWVELHSKPLYEGDRVVGVLGTSRDITARKQMEAELLRMRTLESIGTLAGGIAHDFNNLLMAVTGYISIAKMGLSAESEEFGYLAEAERISLSGKELTRKLITFSEGGISARKALSLKDLVTDSSNIALSGSNIECVLALQDDLCPVKCDEIQIEQTIHNIILNAREAMPLGGTLRIGGANITLSGQENLPLPPGDYVEVSIEDRGRGIRKEDLPKIFDPYFTTKGLGAERGMGLGLAVAYSAIKKHNGHIFVESAVNEGTTVRIYLPACKGAPEGDASPSPPSMKKVLFMDDDDNVRAIGGKLIAHLGYEVALAANGNEALALYTRALESKEPFHAVILDLTIKGGMGGKEAFDKIRSIDPHIKAIISSGYTDDPAISRYREYGFVGVMTKPYKVNDLKRLLKEVTG